MGDRMTVVDATGKSKYILEHDNSIIDLTSTCMCTDDHRPEQRDGEIRVCLICGKVING